MNDVRHVTVIGILIIGMLGLGIPTAFAGSLENWKINDGNQCLENSDECTSRTKDDSSGDTTVRGRNYTINNRTQDNQTVGVLFYQNGANHPYLHSGFCDKLHDQDCEGSLPREVSGRICMKTGIWKKLADPKDSRDYNYDYGQAACWVLNP